MRGRIVMRVVPGPPLWLFRFRRKLGAMNLERSAFYDGA